MPVLLAQVSVGVNRIGMVPGIADRRWPLSNVWLGVSTERQQEADERIPELLQTPAAIRFISAEPLLGPIDLEKFSPVEADWNPRAAAIGALIGIDWVIVGGESGADSRPMHPDWARSLRVQCEAAGVPFFFKQWGNWMPDTPAGSAISGGMVAWPDGSVGRGDAWERGGMGTIMFNRGKSIAGRSLDGIEYSEMPACHAEDRP